MLSLNSSKAAALKTMEIVPPFCSILITVCRLHATAFFFRHLPGFRLYGNTVLVELRLVLEGLPESLVGEQFLLKLIFGMGLRTMGFTGVPVEPLQLLSSSAGLVTMVQTVGLRTMGFTGCRWND